MKQLRVLGLYLLVLTVALFAWSVWWVKHESGRADFSFVIFAPVALGLVCLKRWAIWSSFILGFVSSCLAVGAAVAIGILHVAGFEMRLGPIHLSGPNIAATWIFALVYVLIIGAPMMSAMIVRIKLGPPG